MLSSTEKLHGPEVQPPRPNDNSYWVIPNKLMAGEYPAANFGVTSTRQKIGRYLDKGITFFLDLTEQGEKESYEQIIKKEGLRRGMSEETIEYCRIPIQDFGIPSKEKMTRILDTIDQAIKSEEKNHAVYVHCRGGIGRTGTTIGCFLVRNGNTGDEALEEVNRLFKHSGRSLESWRSPETAEQIDFVRNWTG